MLSIKGAVGRKLARVMIGSEAARKEHINLNSQQQEDRRRIVESAVPI